MSASAGQVLTAAQYNKDTRSGLAFYERGTTSSNFTNSAAVGIQRVNNVPCVAGEPVQITYFGHPDSTVGTDNIRTEVRVNSAGVATASSTLINPSRAFGAASASHRCVTFVYTPSVTANHSFALCGARETGSGTANFYAGDSVRKTQLSVRQFSDGNHAGGENL